MSGNMKESRKRARKRILLVTQAAMIAAMYVALTYIFQPISFGAIQFRISEALTILPMFTPAAITGLFAGCFLGNLLGGGILVDVICGSIATLLGAIGTRLLCKKLLPLGTVPPILANTLIIPFVLKYAYGVEFSLPFIFLTVFVGEVIACGVLGTLLGIALKKRPGIFRFGESEKAGVSGAEPVTRSDTAEQKQFEEDDARK